MGIFRECVQAARFAAANDKQVCGQQLVSEEIKYQEHLNRQEAAFDQILDGLKRLFLG